MTSVAHKVAVLFLAVAALSAGVGASTTYAYFSSQATANGTITTAEDFGYTGEGACIDTDDNWQCNPGDIPVPRRNVSQFTNASADLILPENLGPVVNNSVDITAAGFKTEVALGTTYGDLSVTAESGRLQTAGARINSSSGSVSLAASGGELLANGSRITTGSGTIDLHGAEVHARRASLGADSAITVSGGVADLTETTITGGYNPVSVTADDRLVLDGSATTTSSGSVTLRGGSVSAASTANGSTRVETSNGIDVAATDDSGDIIAPGIELNAADTVDMTASGSMDLDGASVNTDYGVVTLYGQRVSAAGASVASDAGITLNATRSGGGDLDATGVELTGSASIDVAASGRLTAMNASVENTHGSLALEAGSEAAVDDALLASDSDITVTAGGGPLTATNATLRGNYGAIELNANGDVTVDRATITANSGQAHANLGGPYTLYLDDLTIADGDDTLTYAPSNATATGETASGSVEPQ